MERAVYDRMAEIDESHWWFVGRRKIIADLIRKRTSLKSDARILEVGCGTGGNIRLLQRFGHVEAIEPDEAARAFSIQRTGVAIQPGYLPDKVTLKNGAYNLIAMFDVLEHIPDDGAALAMLRSKLADSGRLLVTVPAMPWLWSRHDEMHHHQRRYTARQLRSLFEENGFEISYISFFNSLLFPLIVALRMIGKFLGREQDDDAMPPTLINLILGKIFAAERFWLWRFRLPIGVSIALIAQNQAKKLAQMPRKMRDH